MVDGRQLRRQEWSRSELNKTFIIPRSNQTLKECEWEIRMAAKIIHIDSAGSGEKAGCYTAGHMCVGTVGCVFRSPRSHMATYSAEL